MSLTGSSKEKTVENPTCKYLLYYTSLWTEGLGIEMGLEPVPLQLEHVATNRSRDHHSIYLGQNSVAGRQARLL